MNNIASTRAPSISSQRSLQKKSGLKIFNQGEILFNESDSADSLYIIQKGQIRLFRPKGKGFVELAILRAGEVIGEMAYFDEDSRKRSCSASAIVRTEVVEISFKAFSKTIQGLNPWFKTIINTLADRLRKTNEKVKTLESNSVAYGPGGKSGAYKFLTSSDVVKVLGLLYLVLKTHAEKRSGVSYIHMDKLKFYLLDCFGFAESKYEEFIQLLRNEKFLEINLDTDKLPKVIEMKNVDMLRNLLVFFNTQRTLTDEKKLTISSRCELFLDSILKQLDAKELRGDEQDITAEISSIIENYKKKSISLNEDDLREAIDAGLLGDVVVEDNNKLRSPVNYLKLKKIFPAIRLMNAVGKLNETKSKQ